VHGGVAQAAGQALFEEAAYDDSGQPLAATLMDYAVPRATVFPSIVTLRTETPSPHNPLGAKGVGEAGTIGATPAVANAVIDALAAFGVRHLDMPLTPRKIWMAMRDARQGRGAPDGSGEA
jgi:carbon-monoxide dehydrogenase large subunit